MRASRLIEMVSMSVFLLVWPRRITRISADAHVSHLCSQSSYLPIARLPLGRKVARLLRGIIRGLIACSLRTRSIVRAVLRHVCTIDAEFEYFWAIDEEKRNMRDSKSLLANKLVHVCSDACRSI